MVREREARLKRIGVNEPSISRRAPSQNDMIHKSSDRDVEILYSEDKKYAPDSNLPSIHASHEKKERNLSANRGRLDGNRFRQDGNPRFVKPPLHQVYGVRNDSALQNVGN